ncbi:CPBP family intramembrane glutamic endopeptidase [Halalkalirubrum salinum]|uniref:CPBP family intramembrane glutamic endopeptidase n=1 Tax=Halalkalirubrum salinum TaxID=2563889 RepID=UPI0010FB6B95|nr:type II CAAX endopeptidase family protein [Halalkalirubrum salinum]
MNASPVADERPNNSPKWLVIFFSLTFVFSWALWLPKVVVASGTETGIAVIDDLVVGISVLPEVGAFGPTVSALLLVYIHGGRDGVVRLLKRAIDLSFSRRWLFPAVVLFPVLAIGALGVAVVWGVEPTLPWAGEAYVLPIAFVYILFLGGPLQEELGWRGYALEPLIERFGAFAGSLGLGLVWGVWHLPWFYMPSMTMYYQRPLVGFMITITLLSVVMTWVFQNTGGSLAPMILLHASFNWSLWAFPAIESDAGGQAFIGMLLALVLLIVFRHGRTDFSSLRSPTRTATSHQ